MLKAYKYRIYPNMEQRVQIAKTFGCCRFVYNPTFKHTVQEIKKTNAAKTNQQQQKLSLIFRILFIFGNLIVMLKMFWR